MHKLFDLSGKTALITGASSGLGEQFAHTLSMVGARVVLAARRRDKLELLASSLGNAVAIAMDVSDKHSVIKALDEIDKMGEKIDICINNAGIAAFTPIFAVEENSDFERIIQTNLFGVWYVTRAMANHMKEYGIHGSIINIASVNGANKLCNGISSYAASKAAVIQMTKALVGELSPHKIRINCISPGLLHTPLTSQQLESTAARESLEQLIPLNFIGKPEDLNGALLLLASNSASSYITGTCITIDGGISWDGS